MGKANSISSWCARGVDQTLLVTMGRRKIDITYLQDDRVRKVTFCKRKGGLFKKAEDLAKLCGVEVAVIIVQENQQKTCQFASTNIDRVVQRYKELNHSDAIAPAAPITTAQVDELYRKLEMIRRELEEAQRQLLQERKKVEAFVGQDVQMLTVRPVDMTQMNPPGAAGLPTAVNTTQSTQYPQAQPWQALE